MYVDVYVYIYIYIYMCMYVHICVCAGSNYTMTVSTAQLPRQLQPDMRALINQVRHDPPVDHLQHKANIRIMRQAGGARSLKRVAAAVSAGKQGGPVLKRPAGASASAGGPPAGAFVSAAIEGPAAGASAVLKRPAGASDVLKRLGGCSGDIDIEEMRPAGIHKRCAAIRNVHTPPQLLDMLLNNNELVKAAPRRESNAWVRRISERNKHCFFSFAPVVNTML